MARTDNLVGFLVDSTGVVVRCSIRFRSAVPDSSSIIALVSRLRFIPAQVARRNLSQRFVARLVR